MKTNRIVWILSGLVLILAWGSIPLSAEILWQGNPITSDSTGTLVVNQDSHNNLVDYIIRNESRFTMAGVQVRVLAQTDGITTFWPLDGWDFEFNGALYEDIGQIAPRTAVPLTFIYGIDECAPLDGHVTLEISSTVDVDTVQVPVHARQIQPIALGSIMLGLVVV